MISDKEIDGAWDWVRTLGTWPTDESPADMILRLGAYDGTSLAVISVLAMIGDFTGDGWPPVSPERFAEHGRTAPGFPVIIRRWAAAAVVASGLKVPEAAT